MCSFHGQWAARSASVQARLAAVQERITTEDVWDDNSSARVLSQRFSLPSNRLAEATGSELCEAGFLFV